MAAMGGFSNVVNMSLPPSSMPPMMSGGTNIPGPMMSGANMGQSMPNMGQNMPNMGQNMGSSGNKGGFVTLRLIISREEGQYLFGADEALLGELALNHVDFLMTTSLSQVC